MGMPELISEAVIGIPLSRGESYASEHECGGSKFHSPTPLVTHESDLLAWAPSHAPKVWLCGTCLDNLRVYQSLLIKHDGDIPWPLQRCFGNQIRALAKQGWGIYIMLKTEPLKTEP